MTLTQTLSELEALGTEKMRAQNSKRGTDLKQFGVRMGDIRKVAKKIKTNHALALELWATGIIEAQLLAILIIKPKELSTEELDAMVRTGTFHWVADWLNSYVVKHHPENEQLRLQWMESDDPMAARAGWNLTSNRVVKQPELVDLSALLDRLEAEMASAHPATQWTMNFVLVNIGIEHPEHRKRALAIGEKLGIYSDYPTAKGCTSPFAPIWINEMVSRQS